MKYFLLLLIYLLPFTLSAQFSQEFQQLMMEGIQKHKQGDFEGAISRYEQALELNEHFMVYYEMAYSYHALKDYDKALDLLETSLDLNDSEENVGAYIMYGSILDDQGNTEEAIEFYEDAIEEIDFYLLYYNLAISYMRNGQIDKGLEAYKNNILKNKGHSSPHHDLALFYYERKQTTRALLSGCYFLLMESPDSQRSIMIADMLEDMLGLAASKSNGINRVNINSEEEIFGGVDALINMSTLMPEALEKGMEDTSDTTDRGKFKRKLNYICQMILAANYTDKEDELWIDFYLSFYNSLFESDMYEVFYNIITINKYESSSEWIRDNQDKMKEFGQFLTNKVSQE